MRSRLSVVLFAAAAIALLAAVVYVVSLLAATVQLASGLQQLTGSGPAPDSAESVLTPEPVPDTPPAAASVAAPEMLAAPATPAPSAQAQLLPPPPPGSWEAAPLLQRLRKLGPMGAGLEQGLVKLGPALTPCFTAEGRGGNGPPPGTGGVGGPVEDPSGQPAMVLRLEADADRLQVVDALLDRQGDASDQLIACARTALIGQQLDAPGARPGSRYRLRYTLLPSVAPVVTERRRGPWIRRH